MLPASGKLKSSFSSRTALSSKSKYSLRKYLYSWMYNGKIILYYITRIVQIVAMNLENRIIFFFKLLTCLCCSLYFLQSKAVATKNDKKLHHVVESISKHLVTSLSKSCLQLLVYDCFFSFHGQIFDRILKFA